MKYTYTILSIDKDGIANVEYRHQQLGSRCKSFFLPYDLSKDAIHRIIVEQFPLQAFYRRHLQLSDIDPDEVLKSLAEGSFDVSFVDQFYDIQVETAKTLEL